MQSATDSYCLEKSISSDRAFTVLRRCARNDVDSLSVKEQKMLARHRITVLFYEPKYPDSILSGGADSGKKNGSLSTDRNVEAIVSSFQAASEEHEDSAPLLITGAKRISRVFKPPVKTKGVGVPFSMENGKGVETTANLLSQKKYVGLEAKEGISAYKSFMLISLKGNHMFLRNRRAWELTILFIWLSSTGQI